MLTIIKSDDLGKKPAQMLLSVLPLVQILAAAYQPKIQVTEGLV